MKIHLTNSANRDATIIGITLPKREKTLPAKDGQLLNFKRYVAAGERHLHEDLVEKFGSTDYGKHLIATDPEIDIEIVGRFITDTSTVLLDVKKKPIYCAPELLEITYSADGKEVERKPPVDIASNINDLTPIKWSNRLIPKSEFVRKYSVKRTIQLHHVDGLTFDYLFAMAKELSDKSSVVLLSAGADGKSPLIFSTNSSPYRAFLEGRVKDQTFLLLLHLSNMELKRPASKSTENE
jgi:hypothetical protein